MKHNKIVDSFSDLLVGIIRDIGKIVFIPSISYASCFKDCSVQAKYLEVFMNVFMNVTHGIPPNLLSK